MLTHTTSNGENGGRSVRGGACCHKEILGESRTEGEMEPDCLRSVLRQRFLTFWGGAEQVKVSVTVLRVMGTLWNHSPDQTSNAHIKQCLQATLVAGW